MTHGYSLRSSAKGRQRHQSTGETDDQQVEGTSTSTSTSNKPKAAHIATSSAISTPTTTAAAKTAKTTTYRVQRGGRPRETLEAARERVEAKRIAEAVRIRREQIVRGYDEELRALHARIEALRLECEERVEKVRRKWARVWEMERDEVAGEDEEEGEGEGGWLENSSEWMDAPSDGEMEMEMGVDMNHAPTVLGMRAVGPSQLEVTEDDNDKRDDDERQPGPAVGKTQTVTGTSTSGRQQTMGFPTLNHHPSQGRKSHNSRPHQAHAHAHPHLQPLRRQPAQLMAIPTYGSSRDTYGTAVLDP
jgi:hypothetical protein